MEDQGKRLLSGVALGLDLLLGVLENLRTQLDVSGLVDAVGVPESSGDDKIADPLERVVGLQNLLRLSVEPGVIDGGIVHPVLFAPGNPQLELEGHIDLAHPGQVLLADCQVLFQRLLGEIQHVRAVERFPVLFVVRLAGGEHSIDPGKKLLRTVVRVKNNRDAVFFRDDPDVVSPGDGACDRRVLSAIIQKLAGVKEGAAV